MLYSIPGYDRWATSAPDEFDYPTRCEGTKHHKCGRFLAWGQSACERCQTELNADWREMMAREPEQDRQYNAEMLAADDVYAEMADLYGDLDF